MMAPHDLANNKRPDGSMGADGSMGVNARQCGLCLTEGKTCENCATEQAMEDDVRREDKDQMRS